MIPATNTAIVWECVAGKRVGVLHRQVDAGAVLASLPHNDKDCVLVHDPENKARYVVQPQVCEDTMGYKDYKTKKQSFLCMLYQKGSCRAKGSCNQLHISQGFVKGVRSHAASLQGAYTVQKKDHFVAELTVLDHSTREKLILPYHLTHATVGRQLASKGSLVEICKFHFSSVGCRYASSCRSVHVKPAYKSIQASPCCPFHVSDMTGEMDKPERVTVLNQAGCAVPVPSCYVSTTKGLTRLLDNDFPVVKICTHFQQARCVHGHLCNNIHVCRSWMPGSLSMKSSSSSGSLISDCLEESCEVEDFADLPQLIDELADFC
eukprot:TRINITY_DN1644_c1_g2_i1.p1 TRINITY_DN1644_c1_g2~~TRINITY_DN1644_c1_g2_i1.p1  ORF type:complete len:337 (+),score=46.59 TRINITY_DN1644_c1_g2_i1:52-1011(+)